MDIQHTDQTVTIPRAEYEDLVRAREDLADLRAVEAARAEPGPGIPAELVRRMVAGEPPLRILREWRGLSQSALSRLSGVNRVQIGDIEDRGRSGSVPTLRRLAEALDVTLDDLV